MLLLVIVTARENMGRQHTYKLPNLFSIISDLGWTV